MVSFINKLLSFVFIVVFLNGLYFRFEFETEISSKSNAFCKQSVREYIFSCVKLYTRIENFFFVSTDHVLGQYVLKYLHLFLAQFTA